MLNIIEKISFIVADNCMAYNFVIHILQKILDSYSLLLHGNFLHASVVRIY